MKRWSVQGGAVLACSALKHSYRKQLRAAVEAVQFVFLEGDADIIARRLTRRAQRNNHIVKNFKAILEGQFRDLEIPKDALALSIQQPPDQIVDEILMAVDPNSFA
jgi:carbohydrate kinase (thermoresistant glucokinase family)